MQKSLFWPQFENILSENCSSTWKAGMKNYGREFPCSKTLGHHCRSLPGREGGRGALTCGNALETSANTGFLTFKSSASVYRFLLIILIMSGWLLLLSYPLVCLLRPLSPVSRIVQISPPGCVRLWTSSLKSPKARPRQHRAQPEPHWDPGGIAAGREVPHTAPKLKSLIHFTPLLVWETLSRQIPVVCKFPST